MEQLIQSILPRSLRDIEAFAAAARPSSAAAPADRGQLDKLLDDNAYTEPAPDATVKSPDHAAGRTRAARATTAKRKVRFSAWSFRRRASTGGVP